MIPVMCVTQEGLLSADAAATLKAEIGAFTGRAFDEQADIDWIVVPAGSGFTAAEPSTSLIASMQANRPLQAPERIALLRELSDMCMREANRTKNEVVASIRDPH